MINMKGEGNYYHCNLKQDFRKEIGKIKLKLKVLSLVSVLMPNNTFFSYNIPFSMCCGNVIID